MAKHQAVRTGNANLGPRPGGSRVPRSKACPQDWGQTPGSQGNLVAESSAEAPQKLPHLSPSAASGQIGGLTGRRMSAGSEGDQVVAAEPAPSHNATPGPGSGRISGGKLQVKAVRKPKRVHCDSGFPDSHYLQELPPHWSEKNQ